MTISPAAKTIDEALDLSQTISQWMRYGKSVRFTGIYPIQHDPDGARSLSVTFAVKDAIASVRAQEDGTWCGFVVTGTVEQEKILILLPGNQTRWRKSTAIACFEWLLTDIQFSQT